MASDTDNSYRYTITDTYIIKYINEYRVLVTNFESKLGQNQSYVINQQF